MATKPTDRFDNVPDDLLRTGAHRAGPKKGRGWIAFAWAALATGVLVGAGVFGLAVIRGTVELPFLSPAQSATPTATAAPTPTPTPTGTPTAAPKINPALAISILNGTPTKGLAAKVGNSLVNQGWTGASTDVGSRGNAPTTTVTKTLVYYRDPANEGAARALVQSLKVGEITLSSAYPSSPLTVVLGSDYKLPAG
jgi:hypothetical protein